MQVNITHIRGKNNGEEYKKITEGLEDRME